MPGQSRRSAQSYLDEAKRLETAGRQSDAIAALMKAVRLASGQSSAPTAISAWAVARVAGTQEAMPPVAGGQSATSLKADFGPAHFHLAVALQDQGRGDEAICPAFRKAIALGSNQREAHARLGDLLLPRGDVAGAADAYRRASSASAAAGRRHIA